MPLLFRVRVNQSYDHSDPRPGEVRFPEDSARDRAMALSRCDADTAIAELWRDGRVPEWVNVAVVDETGMATVIEIVCCGRFTDDEDRLYNAAEGVPPFHVLGPMLPASHDGTPFGIHHRVECWDRSDADRLTGVAAAVCSLTLTTDEFDNDALSALPDLPNVEIFEHRACTLGADAMAAFFRCPRLRVLRLLLTKPEPVIAFSRDGRTDQHGLSVSSSTDGGITWSAALTVSTATTTVMPWVAARGGKVDVVYYGSSAASTDDPSAVWNTYDSQFKNGTWMVKTVSNTPNRVGRICLEGSGCVNNTDRELLDLFEVTEDPVSGKAAVIYTDSTVDTYNNPSGVTKELPEIVLAFEN